MRSSGRVRALVATLALVLTTGLSAPAALGRADLYESYLEILQGDPYQEYALRRLLEVSGDKGGLDGLVGHLKERLTRKPQNSSMWLVLGHVHREARQAARALTAYERAAALLSARPGPRIAMARLHRQGRSWDASLVEYDAAIERVGRDRDTRQEVLLEALETALEASLLERADVYGAAYLANRPGHVPSRMELATTFGRLGHPDLALKTWAQAREQARGQLRYLVAIWPEMARLQEQGGQLDAAESTWREALKALPASHWARPACLDGLIGVYRRRDALRQLLDEWRALSSKHFLEAMAVSRLHEELGEDAEALQAYQRAAQLRRGDLESRKKVVELLRRRGTIRDLLKAYQELERVAPHDPSFPLERAELALQKGERRQGLTLLKKVLRRFSRDPGVHQRSIDLLIRYGGKQVHGLIERSYQRLIRLEPREDAHIVSLGELFWSQGKRARAEATWRGILSRGKSKGRSHQRLAEVFSEHDLNALAEQHYAAAVKAAPEDLRVITAQARWFRERRRTRDAVASWRRALDVSENNADQGLWATEARRAIIELWSEMGRLDTAIKELSTTANAKPPDLKAGLLLTEALLYQRRWDEAERYLLLLRDAVPDRLDVLQALEALYTRSNRHKDALGILDDIARRDDAYGPEILARAARLALRTGDKERSLRLALELAKESGGGASARIEAGELLTRLGQLEAAAEAWSSALVITPRNDDLRFRLAALYQGLDRPEDEERLLTVLVRESLDQGHVLRGGKRLIQLAISQDRLEPLERVLVPLVAYGGRRREVHLRLLISVYSAMTQRLRWTPDAEDQLRALGERALNPLIEALGVKDVSMRGQALDVLDLTGRPGAVPALSRLLNDGDASTRLRAAMILGGLGTNSSVTALSRFAGRNSASVKQMAIWALGLATTPEAETALLKLEGLEPADRVIWLLALGMQTGEQSGDELRKRLDRGVATERLACIWAVAHQARPESLKALLDVLDKGLLTAAGVGKRCTSRTPCLSPGMGGTSRGTASNWHHLAAWGVGRIGNTEARNGLLERLWKNGPGPQHRAVVVGLLTQPRSEDGVSKSSRSRYRTMIDPRGRTVVADTAKLASLIPTEAESPRALQTQLDLVGEVREVVTRLLEEGQPGRVASFLSGVVTSAGLTLPEVLPDSVPPPVSRQIGELLAPHRERLALWARSPYPQLASASLEVLRVLAERHGRTDDLESLARWGIGHQDHSVRGAAVRLLLTLESIEGMEDTISRLLRQGLESHPVKEALLSQIRDLPKSSGVAVLSLLASDPDPGIRWRVARAAELLCARELQAVVSDLERDRVANVSAAARSARRCHRSPDNDGLFDDDSGRLL